MTQATIFLQTWRLFANGVTCGTMRRSIVGSAGGMSFVDALSAIYSKSCNSPDRASHLNLHEMSYVAFRATRTRQ
ncbi:hypothetical protein NOVOSPHI9U_260081 [Novosphingobium sp. 9U]|nr:hypothetical protein NOVOSPHI9U_260081 [Novosphingobium sp. 9U]